MVPYPMAPLIAVNGALYGTTSSGGTGMQLQQLRPGCGTVCSVDTAVARNACVYRLSRAFREMALARTAGLVILDGNMFYGTTADGGTNHNEGDRLSGFHPPMLTGSTF